ncbi:MAG: hypothetical protein WC663_03530 [Patescibacteria group bacterium]|jgi:hypothetical protein
MSEEMDGMRRLRCGRHLLVALHDCLFEAEDQVSLVLTESLEEAMIHCGNDELKEATLFFADNPAGDVQFLRLREAWKILHKEMTILDAGIRLHADSLAKEGRKNV